VQTRRIVDPRYGAKLTGKLGARSSIGLFVADDEAPGKVDNIADPAYGQKAQNVLGRYKFDLYRNSHVGVIFTDREFMNDYSRLVMLDAALRMGETEISAGDTTSIAKTVLFRKRVATEISVRQNTGVESRSSPTRFRRIRQRPRFVQRVDQIQIMTPQFSGGILKADSQLARGSTRALYDYKNQVLNADYTPNVSLRSRRTSR
jgi:hypothetical protein